tara:strand:+ start:3030 stop:4100 length:1071 start_codon:yes stop_codon:yes gene_type:complete
MSYKIPTPLEIAKRVEADSALSTGTQHASLPGTAENMVSRALTIVSTELYSYLSFIAKQILPPTAEAQYLEGHANFWLEGGRKSSSLATGLVDIEGTAGTEIAAGSILVRDDSISYRTLEDLTLDGSGLGSVRVNSRSEGLIGNAAPGVSLNPTDVIPGITSITVAADGLSGGAEIEADPDLKGRVVERVQSPPRGGSLRDYEFWAKEVAGVTRSWAKESDDGYVTVHVTFSMDNKPDTPQPTADEVQAVKDHIESVRPVGSRPSVVAPVLSPIDFEIALNPNNLTTQNAALAEIEDYFKREASAGGVTLRLSRLSAAISVSLGENFHQLITPNQDLAFEFGTLPVLGNITWSAAA